VKYLFLAKKSALFAFAICLCIVLPVQTNAQQNNLTFNHPDRAPTMQELLNWKEVFTYEVRYSFFKLGEVETTIVRDTTYDGQKMWWLRTIITSNPGIPFVGKEENHYNTLMVETDSLPYTELYWRDNVDEEEFDDERYVFDYENEQVYYSEKGTAIDTLALTERASSGQLIFYYSRLFAGTDKPYRLPVYLEGEKGYINGSNSSDIEMREYDAFEEPVKTYFSEGDANIDGPFGFRGKYKAWYIADDLRIPAEAHARVWLGNVKVKIIDYQKEPRNRSE
jgi:hypothetical protein